MGPPFKAELAGLTVYTGLSIRPYRKIFVKPFSCWLIQSTGVTTLPTVNVLLYGQKALCRHYGFQMNKCNSISGQDIALGAYILTVADAFYTMNIARAYRYPISNSEAQSELVWCSGTQFDPDIGKAMIIVLRRF